LVTVVEAVADRFAARGQQRGGGVGAGTIYGAQLRCVDSGDGVDVALQPGGSASSWRQRAVPV
jgi:hypothetical protein